LAAAHHVTMIDAVGDLNKSVARKPVRKVSDLVAWLDESLRALSIDRSAVVGMSMGAWMATQYALAHPANVERLAVICPAGIVGRQHTRWLLTALWRVNVRPSDASLEAFLDALAMPATRPNLRADPWRPIVQQFIKGSVGFRPALVQPYPLPCKLDRLAASSIPILVIIGRNETIHDGPTMADRFSVRVPTARVEVVDDANHMLPMDQPDVLSKLLMDFLGA
jgi:pimeloyl-ACP methyl ester carboxylesterase